jgi:hypothetical protein
VSERDESENVHDEVDDGGDHHLPGVGDEVEELGAGRARRHVRLVPAVRDLRRRQRELRNLHREERRRRRVALVEEAARVAADERVAGVLEGDGDQDRQLQEARRREQRPLLRRRRRAALAAHQRLLLWVGAAAARGGVLLIKVGGGAGDLLVAWLRARHRAPLRAARDPSSPAAGTHRGEPTLAALAGHGRFGSLVPYNRSLHFRRVFLVLGIMGGSSLENYFGEF